MLICNFNYVMCTIEVIQRKLTSSTIGEQLRLALKGIVLFHKRYITLVIFIAVYIAN